MRYYLAMAAAVVLWSSAAQAASNIPETTLSCADVAKNPDGSWTATKAASFDFAGFQVHMKAGSNITDTSYFYDNHRLIDALKAKCGG